MPIVNRRLIIEVFILLILVTSLSGCGNVSTSQNNSQNNLQDIASSHIEANVPDKADFDRILKRDLKEYFGNQGNDVSVRYELLRDGPTQTGISYPKYYAWVQISAKDVVVDQGAVRLAAMDKQRFDVTHFLSINEIKNNPDSINSVFPKPVCEKIKEKLKYVTIP